MRKRIPPTDYCDEIYKRIFLMCLFGNDDREEFYTDENNKIWQIDNSWCFYDYDFIKLINHKDSVDFDATQMIEQQKQNRLHYIKDNFRRVYVSVRSTTSGKEIAKRFCKM